MRCRPEEIHLDDYRIRAKTKHLPIGTIDIERAYVDLVDTASEEIRFRIRTLQQIQPITSRQTAAVVLVDLLTSANAL